VRHDNFGHIYGRTLYYYTLFNLKNMERARGKGQQTDISLYARYHFMKEDIEMFHFGASTYYLVFRPEVKSDTSSCQNL
jgi:hypothetical protein